MAPNKPAARTSAAPETLAAIKKYPGATAFIAGALLAIARPALSMLYSQALSADTLYRESEMRRTGKRPASGGPELSVDSGGIIKTLNYFGFTMAQNAARLSAGSGLVLAVDEICKEVRKVNGALDSVHAGRLIGRGVKVTRVIQLASNHVRHAAGWRRAKNPKSMPEFSELRRAGVTDPLSVDVPIDVIRLVGVTYFAFEDTVGEALSDLMLDIAEVPAHDRTRSLFEDLEGRKINLSLDLIVNAIAAATSREKKSVDPARGDE